MNKLLPGFSSDLLLEIPPFRLPSVSAVVKKLWMRISSYLTEAVPFLLAGVFVVNVLYTFGVFDHLAGMLGPHLHALFGLPKEAISALLMGFLRKDLAMGLLVPLGLSAKQLVVASTILAVYFPCVATFVILVRELGAWGMLQAAVIMIIATVTVGAFVNLNFKGGSLTTQGWLLMALTVLVVSYLPQRRT